MQVYQKYQNIRKDNLLLSYTGLLNIELISQLMKLTETTLITNGVHIKQRKSVVNILIEALQNMLYHTETLGAEMADANSGGACLIQLGKEQATYSIVTGNYIRNESIPALQYRLNSLSPMSMEQLNEHYLLTLGKGEISAKGGAGLGLIRIFLDSKKQTSFAFEPVNAGYSFFTMQIKISA